MNVRFTPLLYNKIINNINENNIEKNQSLDLKDIIKTLKILEKNNIIDKKELDQLIKYMFSAIIENSINYKFTTYINHKIVQKFLQIF